MSTTTTSPPTNSPPSLTVLLRLLAHASNIVIRGNNNTYVEQLQTATRNIATEVAKREAELNVQRSGRDPMERSEEEVTNEIEHLTEQLHKKRDLLAQVNVKLQRWMVDLDGEEPNSMEESTTTTTATRKRSRTMMKE